MQRATSLIASMVYLKFYITVSIILSSLVIIAFLELANGRLNVVPAGALMPAINVLVTPPFNPFTSALVILL